LLKIDEIVFELHSNLYTFNVAYKLLIRRFVYFENAESGWQAGIVAAGRS